MSIDVEGLTERDELAALVRAGGNPYILISLVDHTTGRIELLSAGFGPEQIVMGLREAADQLAADLIEQSLRDPAEGDFDHLPLIEQSLREPRLDLEEALERARQL